MMTADTLAAALEYAARGWRTIPILPGKKRPRGDEWQLRATTDTDQLHNWWGTGEDGIGIATGPASGIFVLDVDVADGKAGDETLAELESLYGQLPDTLEVRTGSGGRHIYFRWPTGLDIRNDASKRLGPGIDIRGEGGQVVAPPTLHPNGNRYEWDLGSDELADAPGWLLQLLTEDPWKNNATSVGQPPTSSPSAPPLTRSPGSASTLGDVRTVSEPDSTSYSVSPAEHYNQTWTWPEILSSDGWTLDHVDRSGEQHWVRPGKDARDGTSATVGWKGMDVLVVFTTSLAWLPPGSYSRFGYYARRHHGGDRSAAAAALRREMGGWMTNAPGVSIAATHIGAHSATSTSSASTADTSASTPSDASGASPETPIFVAVNPLLPSLLDWTTAWKRERSDESWFVEPFLADGRGHALWAGAKTGKSLVTLYVLAAKASGRPVLLDPGHDPAGILYVDWEMTEDDVLGRLEEWGYGPDSDLSRLHYGVLPRIDPLDTITGGHTVLEAAQDLGCRFVVFDTMSRAVSGDENESSTYRAFYAHTGLLLKNAGIGYVRLDHGGKDTERGQRGSSAKNDDVDVVWRLERRDEGAMRLTATHRRMGWVPEQIDLTEYEDDDLKGFRMADEDVQPTGTYHAVRALDEAGFPTSGRGAGRVAVRKWLREQGFDVGDRAVRAAMRIRARKASECLALSGTRGPDADSPDEWYAGEWYAGDARVPLEHNPRSEVVSSGTGPAVPLRTTEPRSSGTRGGHPLGAPAYQTRTSPEEQPARSWVDDVEF